MLRQRVKFLNTDVYDYKINLYRNHSENDGGESLPGRTQGAPSDLIHPSVAVPLPGSLSALFFKPGYRGNALALSCQQCS